MIGRGPGPGARGRAPLLFLVPLLTYLASYSYLAWWVRGTGSPWTTPVHESGLYALGRTALYASHFLGHIPVHTALACFFVGTQLMLFGPGGTRFRAPDLRALGLLLGAFLALCLALSLTLFGLEDTLAYLLQRRQRPGAYAAGGSWNLHLPSSVLMPFLIPAYVLAAGWLLRVPLRPGREGHGLLWAGAALIGAMSLAVNFRDPGRLVELFRDPRYLAHSVRELATFPLTYLPLPLATLRRSAPPEHAAAPDGRTGPALAACAGLLALFLVGLGHQVRASLDADLLALASPLAAARDGSLDVPYLLSSHFFEHFLDSLYFWLLSLWLFARTAPRRLSASNSF